MDSHQTTLNILGRPVVGLNLMGNASYLQSKSSSEISTSKSKAQNYGAGYSYTLPIRNLTFNSSYRFDYGIVNADPGTMVLIQAI